MPQAVTLPSDTVQLAPAGRENLCTGYQRSFAIPRPLWRLPNTEL